MIENGADEELLTKLGYHNIINSSKNIKANIIDYILNKCKNNKALLAGSLALLISTGQLFGYEVKKGDTLWGIAKKSNCQVEDIYKVNPGLKNKKVIRPGMNIVIPNKINENTKEYQIQKGDTLWGIAKKFNCQVEDIYKVNPGLKNKKIIRPGMNIVLPEIKKNNNSNESTEQLNMEAALKALREVESDNGINTVGDGGKAIGDYQLWEIFVKDYHRLGGKKDYKCHIVDGVVQSDDVRWDRKKSEEMIKYVFNKYGYKNM